MNKFEFLEAFKCKCEIRKFQSPCAKGEISFTEKKSVGLTCRIKASLEVLLCNGISILR